MLKGLLENKVCGECKICCGFDNTDIWEMPVMTKKSMEKLKGFRKETEFVEKDGGYVVKPPVLEDEELFLCPALDKKTGCTLGEDKPFDCQIWPYRVMELEGRLCITISPVCEELFNRPLSQLVSFLEENLTKVIYQYAQKHPEIVKKYDHSYPILNVLTDENTGDC